MHPWFALPFEVKNDFFYFKAYKFFEGFPQTATNWIKSAQIEYLGIVTNVNTLPTKVHLVEG
jgi:hypothetical protein